MALKTLLAIETSCDETAAAVIRNGQEIVSSMVSSQIKLHAPHGGVIPELAAREHLANITLVVDQALAALPQKWDELDGVVVTRGPGLVGCLVIGVAYAQAIAAARGLPIVGVSHLAGHIYSAWLAEPAFEPPYTALLVSGGHTECVLLQDFGNAETLLATRDDAVGEAFDKAARILGLGYPGGPVIEKLALGGEPGRFNLPHTRLQDSFSFSGLKTALMYKAKELDNKLDSQAKADLALAFQQAAISQLIFGLEIAIDKTRTDQIAVVGGVAANMALAQAVKVKFAGLRIVIPPMGLCTDNAAMIGAVGWHQLQQNFNGSANSVKVDPALAEFI